MKTWIYRVRYQLLTVLFIWIVLFLVIEKEHRWTHTAVIRCDVAGYYGYLPAKFIHHDLHLHYFNDSLANALVHVPQSTADGKRYFKYTMGMSYLFFPFFAGASAYVSIKGDPADGFSEPYQIAIAWAPWFYLLFGLWFLWKYLRNLFSEGAIALTLILVVFGTNLFFYTTGDVMPHAFNFTLYAMLLYYCRAHAQMPSVKKMAIITFLAALLTLIRPVNILAVFFVFFINGLSFEEVKKRFNFIFTKKVNILFILLIAFIVIFPQLLYWKYTTGHWIIYSYANETFDFTNPHIVKGLFSYQKGWLVYSPIWLLMVPGFYFLYRKNKKLCWSILLFFVIYTYVIYSWWAWTYGGSFGGRAMIDIYPVLAIPLAAFLDRLLAAKVYYKLALCFPLVFVVILNLFQTFQFKSGLIHWNGMSKETYWTVFGRTQFSDEEIKFLQESWIKNDR